MVKFRSSQPWHPSSNLWQPWWPWLLECLHGQIHHNHGNHGHHPGWPGSKASLGINNHGWNMVSNGNHGHTLTGAKWPNFRKRDRKTIERYRTCCNRHYSARPLPPLRGEKVLVKIDSEESWKEPGIVKGRTGQKIMYCWNSSWYSTA